MFLLPFHIGIQQAHITFPSPPEHVVFTIKCDGGIQCGFYLCSTMGQYLKIRIGRGAIHVTSVTEEVGCTPKKLDTTRLLFLFRVVDDCCQSFFVFQHIIRVIHQVYIMKTVVWNIHFTDKFKSSIHLIFCTCDRVITLIPGESVGWPAKWIGSVTIEGMPIGTGKFKILFHRFTCNDLFWVVITKSKWIFTFLSFKFDLYDPFKKLFLSFNNIHFIWF
ncbi:hypothetical protein D3C73_842530 [compost metagenome]